MTLLHVHIAISGTCISMVAVYKQFTSLVYTESVLVHHHTLESV